MSLVTWSREFETGIGIIDEQHQRFFDLVNALQDDIDGGNALTVIGEHLARVEEHALMHFATEASLMEQHGYVESDSSSHQKIHDDIVVQIIQLQKN